MTPEEQKLHQESDRGARAAALLSDPLFQEAFSTVERVLIDKWLQAPVRDTEGHHELLLMAKAVRAVHKHIVTVATTGRMASMQIRKARERRGQQR